jgi:hypothetical protein
MHNIVGNVFSHTNDNDHTGRWTSVKEVRTCTGPLVNSYRDLVSLVAELGYRNRRLFLLYRGQRHNPLARGDSGPALYPSIYRPEAPGGRKLSRRKLKARFDALRTAITRLRDRRADLGDSGPGLYRHWEYQAALLQHYELCPTPLLDASSSLRVACSFALREVDGGQGFLFVLGVPYPHGCISHFVEDDLALVRLQGVCPPAALRPHYQDGYLLGTMTAMDGFKGSSDNAAYRLVAKYRLNNEQGRFWDGAFQPLPYAALMPARDAFLDTLRGLLPAPQAAN